MTSLAVATEGQYFTGVQALVVQPRSGRYVPVYRWCRKIS